MPLNMIEQDTSMPFAKSIFSFKKKYFLKLHTKHLFGKKCEHRYYKVRTGNALKDNTEAIHKGIRNKYDTFAFGQNNFCKVWDTKSYYTYDTHVLLNLNVF